MTFVWTTSLLSSYFLIGTVCFSETMGLLGVLSRFSGGTLLALAAAHLISPITGAGAAGLLTCYGAGMLGYSIGEHLQRIGVEKSAAVAASRVPRDEEQEKRREECLVSALCLLVPTSLLALARMVWVVFVPGSAIVDDPADEPLSVVHELAQETLFLAWVWSRVVALPLLEGAFVSVDTVWSKGFACFAASEALNIVFLIVKRNAACLLVVWTVSMATVGFFGYCLALYARYKHIIRSRNLPVSASSSLPQDGPKEPDQQPLLTCKVLDKPDQKPACGLLQVLADHDQELGLRTLVDEAR